MRYALLILLTVGGALSPGAANALIGIRVEVIGDASGTLASGVQESDGTVVVTPSPADTALTFRVTMDTQHTISGYISLKMIDAGEISFATSADLSGLGFLSGFEGNPSAVSGFGSVTTTQLYEVTYDLGTLDSASGVDWQLDVAEVHQGFPAENNIDPAANAASVQIDAPAGVVPALGVKGVVLFILMVSSALVYHRIRRARTVADPPGRLQVVAGPQPCSRTHSPSAL
ncbi:MAG: hypothetical protein Q8R92_14585 [Deltaproteobacteria bacterium]|nr:hypothetical protein [Deltaproteobacteria bacterium]